MLRFLPRLPGGTGPRQAAPPTFCPVGGSCSEAEGPSELSPAEEGLLAASVC